MRRLPRNTSRTAMALLAVAAAYAALTTPCQATPFAFSTGDVDGRIATASRPGATGGFEIESADDFTLTSATILTSATFTGLLTGTGASVSQVVVEIYRVFPLDSDVSRTSGPPTFSTSQVPTRVNSPSDVALEDRDSADAGALAFVTTTLNSTFTASNSVQAGGIHPQPGQSTGGNGAVTGAETLFSVTFTLPITLDPGHYFFVPQVAVNGGDFLWLSSIRPIVPPGTPFAPDLQSWTRDAFLDPDWLRIGTDIVGGATPPTFNAAFSLAGTVPEPPTSLLLALGAIALAWRVRKRS
jgi:hypothetical protein